MEKWKQENIPYIETINSDIKIDTPPNPIKERIEMIQNIHFSHAQQCKAI
jgi:hypothetical protein